MSVHASAVWRSFRTVAASLVLACAAMSAAAGSWTTRGPYGGLTEIIVVDPVTPATVYAASFDGNSYGSVSGSVFKSVDSGAHWARATAGLTDPFCVTLVMDPADHETLYAAGGNGVFKTTDGAGHWTQISALVNVAQLAIDPKSPNTLYALITGGALQKSTDGGRVWVSLYNAIPNERLNALVIDPASPRIMYVAAEGGIYKTVNGGASWTLLTAGLGTAGSINVLNVWIDPSTPSTLYADAYPQGLVKSVDGGLQWNPVAAPFDSQFFTLTIDPSHPDTLYGTSGAGISGALYVSSNAGKTWTQPAGPAADFYALAVDPAASANLYAATDQGVFVSVNQGATWTESNLRLANTTVTALAINPERPDEIYAGTDSHTGIFRSTTGGATWTRLYTGSYYVASLLLDPAKPNVLYYADLAASGAFKSIDSGASWTNILPNGIVLSMTLDQQNPENVFAGVNSGVYRSANGGKTWALQTKGLPVTGYFQPISISAAGLNVMLTDPENGIYLSANGGRNWAASDPRVLVPAVQSGGSATINNFAAGIITGAFSMQAGLASPEDVDLGFARGVLHGGAAAAAATQPQWTPWGAPVGVNAADCAPMTALVADPVTATTFYVGGICGVLKGTNNGAQLAAIGAGLPANVPVFALAVTPTADALYAGTYGGGVYRYVDP